MAELLLSIFFAYRNAMLAKTKGQNTVVWVIITIVTFFLAYGIGGGILISILYKGPLERDTLISFLLNSPILLITILFFGVGGYLLIRYILEKMPDKKSE